MKKFWNSAAGLVLYIVIVFGLAFFVSTFCIGRIVVDGPSMKPTLYNNESVIVNKIQPKLMKLKRFEVIVFDYKYEVGTRYVKRVIGLPGETVRIDEDGNIFINEELLEEHYGKDVMVDQGIAADGIILGEDEYFVLGDNRNNSTDSREPDVGKVSKDQVYGVVMFRLLPFEKFGPI